MAHASSGPDVGPNAASSSRPAEQRPDDDEEPPQPGSASATRGDRPGPPEDSLDKGSSPRECTQQPVVAGSPPAADGPGAGAGSQGVNPGGGGPAGDEPTGDQGRLSPVPPPPLSDEQVAALLDDAEDHKRRGNELYGQGSYEEAIEAYWQAVDAAPDEAEASVRPRAVYFANLAACHLKLHQWREAVQQCNSALALDEGYIKALMRRAGALQELDDPEHALADAQKVLELDPGNAWAVRTVGELGPRVAERQERVKEEMLGKLKELGNSLLGKVGLSLDNFKVEQDPSSGGYSIKFQ